jgi:V/A-type H+-transporting ATPase subunit E
MPKNKTDNFLKAIKKYANAQKRSMQGEVKQLKSERLKEAEENAKRDSEQLKREKLHETGNRIAARVAAKTQEGQKNLFRERAKMTDKVFELASQKLLAYTQTEEYTKKFFDGAKAIAELFDGKACVVYIREQDAQKADELKNIFGGNTEIKVDKTIKIGGVKGYCESMGIIADETLDSKLEEQRGWFVENAGLSVL